MLIEYERDDEGNVSLTLRSTYGPDPYTENVITELANAIGRLVGVRVLTGQPPGERYVADFSDLDLPPSWRVRGGEGYLVGWDDDDQPIWERPGDRHALESISRDRLARAAEIVRDLRDEGYDAWLIYDPPPKEGG